MSIENALAFLSKISQDEDLAGKAEGAKNEEDFLNVAREAGWECSAAELKRVAELTSGKEGDTELSETDLESVAGGAWRSSSFRLSSLRFNFSRLSKMRNLSGRMRGNYLGDVMYW